jgi:hypothetical protein
VADLVRSLSRNWLPLLAFTLAYTAIALNLGPAFLVVAWFLSGCAYIIYLALR